MQWRHHIAVVLVTILAGLTVSGTVCAMACDSASTARAAHHGSDQNCEESGPPSSGPQISGHAGHDCGSHDTAIQQASTTAATRACVTAISVPLTISAVPAGSTVLREARAVFDYSSPPGTPPTTVTPLVLRV